MSNRFIDNETPLNATILNGLEDYLKKYFKLPVFNAVYEASSSSSFFNYKISDQRFDSSLKTGFTFIMIPNVSSRGTSNQIIAIKHGNLGDPLYWNNNEITPTVGYGYARVSNDIYFEAGKPYIVKCFTKVQNNYQFVITELVESPQMVLAGEHSFGGIKIYNSGSNLFIET